MQAGAEQLQQLPALTVVELRAIARRTRGIAIRGRKIAQASKRQLIEEILQAAQKFPEISERDDRT